MCMQRGVGGGEGQEGGKGGGEGGMREMEGLIILKGREG